MQVEGTGLDGLLLIRPRVFADHRGYFYESFNEAAFRAATGVDRHFVQDNESRSDKGVLRGLHFQLPPHAQGKLVRVVKGAVLDVCVDIRPESPTYGRHFKAVLDGDSKTMLYIPEGFAHGFHTLEDGTVFAYKCTAYYDKGSERTIRWDDPALGIDWGAEDPVLSEKDLAGIPFGANPWPKAHV
ncbi:MAG: dTDP-4-dehydrorhamnose 3,5-epimerase [Flavobacteriales bacterium]|nr:dTDP-4-dehydrorhamnose 3,5-epimerase [Flavobacteriales bacterium]